MEERRPAGTYVAPVSRALRSSSLIDVVPDKIPFRQPRIVYLRAYLPPDDD